MRLLVFAISTAAAIPAAASGPLETRSACMQELQRALAPLRWAENVREIEGPRFAAAPEAGREYAEAAMAALDRRAQAQIDYADALMKLCESYDTP